MELEDNDDGRLRKRENIESNLALMRRRDGKFSLTQWSEEIKDVNSINFSLEGRLNADKNEE